MVASAASPDDVIVAQVNGRPVWGSCVATQAAASRGKTKQVALDECIQFELLAQAAEQKGLDRHAETVDATRTALVARLVDQFAARTTPDALKTKIDEIYKPATFTVPERRESFQALVLVAEKAPDADHVAARALAAKIHDALKDETGLLAPHFQETVARVTAGTKLKLDIGKYQPIAKDHDRTLPEYRGALFAIPEVGRISPVTKTMYGYHVILFTAVAPAVALDRVAAGEVIHPNLQRRMFEEFFAEVVASSKTKVEPHFEVLDQLAQERK
jgi:hypothetical protein